jgi:CRISPR-associated protein (TIGR02710 family)
LEDGKNFATARVGLNFKTPFDTLRTAGATPAVASTRELPMAEQNVKALILSVGTSEDAAVSSINRLNPECICFFVSEAGKGEVDQKIIPRIERPPKQWDQIVTPDPDDFLKCCRVLTAGIPAMVARWQAEPSQVVVDATGGSPTMASALVLCSIDHASGYQTAGGGTPEAELQRVNPWDELAAGARREAARAFNHSRFRGASDQFTRIQTRVSGGGKPLYKALSVLSLGYAAWDAFDYRQGWNRLQEAKKSLEMATVFGGPPGLKGLVGGMKANLSFLERIAMGSQEIKPELFLDLLANARRRALHEQRYEDAVARLHRALEVLSQVALSRRGIRSSAVDPAKVPESVRAETISRNTREIDGKVHLGLVPGFRLLKAMGDPLGDRFDKQWNNIKVLLEARDASVLGHGFAQVNPERYQQLFDLVLKISERRTEEIPVFPRMEFD